MKNKSIALSGYWVNNLGDDLFLELFDKHYPNTQKYILVSRKYAHCYKSKTIKPVIKDALIFRVVSKICRILKLPELFPILFSNKRNIYALLGGSVFMENTNWKQKHTNLEYAVSKSYDSVIIGSNFGPYYSDEYLSDHKKTFSKMGSCTFRDTKSSELFSNLPNCGYAPDLILSIDTSKYTEKKIEDKYFIISVINMEKRDKLSDYTQAYEKKMCDIACKIISDGYGVKLMSFCQSEGDLQSAQRIRSLIDDNSGKVDVVNHTNTDTSLKIISQSEGIVATRFHAMILAFAFNIPVYPICYSKKTTNVIIDYMFKHDYCKVADIDDCDGEKVLKQLFIKPDIPQEIINQAKVHFKYLSKVLN